MRWKRLAKNLSISLAAILSISELPHTIPNLYHQSLPSELRRNFSQTTGTQLHGWEEYVEAFPDVPAQISYAIQRERLEGPIHISSVTIPHNSMFFRGSLDQLNYIYSQLNSIDESQYAGFALPWWHTISVVLASRSPTQEVTHHELYHLKHAQLSNKQEFDRRWNALAKDSSGQTLYRLDRSNKEPAAEYESQGFITSYAGTKLTDDVAEVGRHAEVYADELAQWYFSKNPIGQKLRLLHEYGLLPKEFPQYMKVERVCDGDGHPFDVSKILQQETECGSV